MCDTHRSYCLKMKKKKKKSVALLFLLSKKMLFTAPHFMIMFESSIYNNSTFMRFTFDRDLMVKMN